MSLEHDLIFAAVVLVLAAAADVFGVVSRRGAFTGLHAIAVVTLLAGARWVLGAGGRACLRALGGRNAARPTAQRPPARRRT